MNTPSPTINRESQKGAPKNAYVSNPSQVTLVQNVSYTYRSAEKPNRMISEEEKHNQKRVSLSYFPLMESIISHFLFQSFEEEMDVTRETHKTTYIIALDTIHYWNRCYLHTLFEILDDKALIGTVKKDDELKESWREVEYQISSI